MSEAQAAPAQPPASQPTAPQPTPAQQCRAVARACRTATLATNMAGAPYASLVLAAFDLDAAPLLLISHLAEHTKNLLADPRVSLLCDGTAGYAEPLTGPRATLLGRALRSDEPRHRERFLARHPGAAMYADFKDFAFYKLEIERAHIVSGFGRIHWCEDYRLEGDIAPLAEAEAGIIAHMNSDHADAVALYAHKLLGRDGDGWRLCGIDPEGADLIRPAEQQGGSQLARLPFDKPAWDAETVRVELVRLVKRARQGN